MTPCRGCGKPIHNTAPTCPHCGAPQRTGRRIKGKTVAAVLAIFLGGLGVHRFYLGQWRGLWYLLFCWTGIPGLVALIEGIVFLCSNGDKWDDKFNGGVPSGDSGAGAVLVAIVAVIFIIAVIGILAAIAIPAYQDYLTRSKIVQAVSMMRQATPVVGKYIEKNQFAPESLQAAGFSAALPDSIAGVAINNRTGEMVVTLAGAMQVAGKTFSMLPAVDTANQITWRCSSSTLPAKLLPVECRP